ncbi:ISL3-like element ISArch13 family transposase [Methanocella arvoryzae]|uniref:Transposase n=1 Tax=Methanocella arvoryzae (strain DSM 22066 / NBRC 105507 / MRE50) TaxID=351160 RepID=Q0W4G6_METAR|nr:ISL3-like element ISArch13 family transposase [Methanocella arvoryzae]CAJ36557.1 transposase [Methanocella arvoryzae MRE50]CAJ36727.1 transposase [Methanocella arvoryzae MRE50]
MGKRCKYSLVFKSQFNFKGFKIAGISHDDERLLVELERSGRPSLCPRCGRRVKRVEDEYVRVVRDLDLGCLRCYVQFPQYKIFCRCGHRGHEKLEFVREYSRCTKRLEKHVSVLCKHMSIKEAAQVVGLDWKTVKSIDKNTMRESLVPLDSSNPRVIGVDEIAYEKGHKYLTVVRDVEKGCVLWTGIGRKEVTLDLFFAILGYEKSMNVKAVVMDMWDPYIASVRKNTRAEIVFDKFHIAKKAGECIDSIRRREFRGAGKAERKHWKDKRFLILSREKNLPSEKRETLQELLELNQPLYKAYLLKEQLLDILDARYQNHAMLRLQTWKENVESSGLEEFQALVRTLDRYMYGVTALFKHHITNAGSEGFNTKINIIKRRSYGLQDLEYFMLKILTICRKPSS